MVFSALDGYYVPSTGIETCKIACGICERVCPFEPDNPGTVDLTRHLFAGSPDILYDNVLGYYLQTFAGYSEEHRLRSASGGLLTWKLESLLAGGDLDGVVCVGPDPTSPVLFDYRICRSAEDLRSCCGSCYQPVEVSRALRQVIDQGGRYAIVALPCVARGLRLAMRANDKLQASIRLIIGLVCGQMKSRHFVEYLCHKSGLSGYPSSISFRHKRLDRPANDIAFRFVWENHRSLDIGRTEGVARLWGERWFTLEACDYCDDVFAECADAAFMDAWLPEYAADPRGHSLLLVRNPMLLPIVNPARNTGLSLEPINPQAILASQAGVIHQKRTLAAYMEASCNYSKRIPAIRSLRRKCRFDHQLEAWTKVRIRCITCFGLLENTRAGERLIALLAFPWILVRLLTGFAWRIRRMIRSLTSHG